MRAEKETAWRLATDLTVPFDRMYADSRAAWGSYGYQATWCAAVLAVTTTSRLMPPPEPGMLNAVEPSPPPDLVMSPIPDRRRADQAAVDTWSWIGRVAHESIVLGPEPSPTNRPLERQLKALSGDYKGLAVYMFSWWARSCYEWLEGIDEARAVSLRDEVWADWED